MRTENTAPRLEYLAGLDGLRAGAIMAIIGYHTGILPFLQGGFCGVDVFFVISGYLIGKSLSAQSSMRTLDYFLEFYRGRIIRIFPALIVCLVLTMTVSALFIPASWLSSTNGETGLAAFLGYSNYTLAGHANGYFSPRVEFNPFLHTWSLAVGGQSLLIFPLLFYFGSRLSRKGASWRRIGSGLLPGLAILSLGYACFETRVDHIRAFYLLPGRFWEMAAGALLFQLHCKNTAMANSKRLSSWFLASGTILLGFGCIVSPQDSYPIPWAILPVTGTLLAISGIKSASGKASLLQKILQSKLMVYVGKTSYSLYLWYWPVSVLFRWTIGFERWENKAIGLVVIFLLAAASYHFVEFPSRNLKSFQKLKSWKLAVCGHAALCVAYSAAASIDTYQANLSLSVTRDRYTWYAYPHTPREPNPINTGVDVAGRRLFVIGDSHAAAYRTMLQEVSSWLGVEVHIYEHGGCPLASLIMPMSQATLCSEYYEQTLAEVENMAKPGDIIFLASLRMPELSDQFEVIDEMEVAANFESAKAQGYRQKALEEADQLVERFNAQGLHVLIDAPKPVLKSPPYRCSDWFNKMNPICSPGLSVDREFLLEIRQPVMDSLAILESRHRDLSVWDPFFLLCESDICSAYDEDGKPLFFDGDHLSANGNRVLAPSFMEKILDIWHR
jgi:peptidoglycan/LPS O-acetylase OafA/YrhL